MHFNQNLKSSAPSTGISKEDRAFSTSSPGREIGAEVHKLEQFQLSNDIDPHRSSTSKTCTLISMATIRVVKALCPLSANSNSTITHRDHRARNNKLWPNPLQTSSNSSSPTSFRSLGRAVGALPSETPPAM